ncbi:WPE palindromic element domain-containing protein [Wolbachia endosymbiont (group A) of Bibio marci]|uniref:WPE palindromic element domain-containing protein n=1 Tax=Wolbachia endosymbiont (group A) of Bibio marci TaxID=2953987 RepID=UPI00222F375F|nr:WPE palindromic element domain-containing protein [Wolbachia endosymbiont (group A) of Bibio marci]
MSVATRFFRLLCNKAIPVSGHWDDKKGATGMTGEGATRMTTKSYSDDKKGH